MIEIPDDLKRLIFDPLLKIAKSKDKINKWREFVDEHIDNKQTYFNTFVKYPDFFLDLENRQEFYKYIYQNHIDEYFHTILFNIQNITYRIPSDLDYSREELQIMNDIYLEFMYLEFERYNVKLYHKRSESGITELKRSILDLLEQFFGIHPECRELPKKYEQEFPKISICDISIRNQLAISIYFVQNYPNVYVHNNIYLRINYIEKNNYNLNGVNGWDEIVDEIIVSLEQFLNSLKNIRQLEIISDYDLPEKIQKMFVKNEINLLHISDLHFGIENSRVLSKAELVKRKATINQLLEKLRYLERDYPHWKPNFIVISGDIGFAGKKEDYSMAKDWLTELLSALNLESDKVIISAGNHDRYIEDIMDEEHSYPRSINEADELWYEYNSEKLSERFKNLISFCEENFEPLLLNKSNNFLSGCREMNNIRFIVLNSARFSYSGSEDKGNLFLGWPDINQMINDGLIHNSDDYNEGIISVVIFHHPENWLNEQVLNVYGRHAASYKFLGERCHIFLSGHVHAGELGPPLRIGHGAWHFSVGAIYLRQDYPNNCAILKINLDSRFVKRLKINFNSSRMEWIIDLDEDDVYELYR